MPPLVIKYRNLTNKSNVNNCINYICRCKIELIPNPIQRVEIDKEDDIYIDFNNGTMEESSDSDSSDDITEQNSEIDSNHDDANDHDDYLTTYYYPCGNPVVSCRNHIVSTFETLSCPPGNQMVSTLKQHGVHMETT